MRGRTLPSGVSEYQRGSAYSISGGGAETFIHGDPDQISPNAIASVTKMMTAWVAMKYLSESQLSNTITVTSGDIQSGSRVREGDVYSYRDLLYAAACPSDNTAPWVIARGVGGMISGSGTATQRFIREMNNEAEALNYQGASFTEPWNYGRMSQRQVADLLRRVLGHSTLRTIFGTRTYTLRPGGSNARSVNIRHTIDAFSVEPVQNWIAGKTGTWRGNGYLAIAWNHPDNTEHITVIFDSIGSGAPRYNRLKYVQEITSQ